VKSKMRLLVVPVIVLTLSFNPLTCVVAQQVAGATKQEEARVQQAANRFIKRFRKTLDFSTVFDELFARDAVRYLRRTEFLTMINLTPQLIDTLDDADLKRAYKAFMNCFYLRAFYDFGVGKDDKTPPDVEAVVKVSKFSNLLSDEGSGDTLITTRQEFEDFVKELTRLAALYKRHLTPKVFASAAYKDRVDSDSYFQVSDGSEHFGIAKGTKIYRLDKDLFKFFFIEEKGQMKVLFLGLGD
jgi:hypothetical protein